MMIPATKFSPPNNLVDRLRSAQRIAVLSGAGISAESGVPTFRAAQTGLWARYAPEELATAQAFQRNPQLVWEWYAWRRELVLQAQPNPGHLALVQFEQRFPDFTLITQNVDGLHQLAGNQRVIELHGNIARSCCFAKNHRVENWQDLEGKPPRCPRCNSLLRPDVVWFGESLPREAIEPAWNAAQRCQVFLSVGTSGIVEPAASLPIIALRSGAAVVEINPERTRISAMVDFVLAGPAGVILPALLDALDKV